MLLWDHTYPLVLAEHAITPRVSDSLNQLTLLSNHTYPLVFSERNYSDVLNTINKLMAHLKVTG